MQKIISLSIFAIFLLIASACEQESASPSSRTDALVEVETPSRYQLPVAAFPEGITEIIVPVTGDLSKVELALPYQQGLIPSIGDEAIFESAVNGRWKEQARARVFDVTDQNIFLKRRSGHFPGATRVRVLANPVHRCDLEAASPLDDRAVVPGVEFHEIPIRAIESCGNAASKYAATARFHFQLGRALDAHRQEGPAFARYRYALALDPEYPATLLALGGKYMNGEGVDRNVQEAIRLLHLAHTKGLVRATYLLGQIYEQGVAEQLPDIEKAIGYYRDAGLAADLPAQLRLAKLYEQGEGVEQDMVQALEWFERAATQGHLESQLRLAKAYVSGEGRAQDWVLSRDWWEKAALQGAVVAQLALGNIYELGRGMDSPELTKAMYWYRQAAEQGDAMGQYHVGRMYAEGLGVQEDMDTARQWLLLAREQGVVDADRWLVPEKVIVPQTAGPASVELPEKREPVPVTADDDLEELKRWHVRTQGFMDEECRAILVEELLDLDVSIVPLSQKADVTMVITMNNPEYYSGSMGPFRFTGFNIHYRAEVIRKRDNIRLFYTHGEEDGDDRSESCIDAVDEIIDDLEDEID